MDTSNLRYLDNRTPDISFVHKSDALHVLNVVALGDVKTDHMVDFEPQAKGQLCDYLSRCLEHQTQRDEITGFLATSKEIWFLKVSRNSSVRACDCEYVSSGPYKLFEENDVPGKGVQYLATLVNHPPLEYHINIPEHQVCTSFFLSNETDSD
jgi:hypothetical protein